MENHWQQHGSSLEVTIDVEVSIGIGTLEHVGWRSSLLALHSQATFSALSHEEDGDGRRHDGKEPKTHTTFRLSSRRPTCSLRSKRHGHETATGGNTRHMSETQRGLEERGGRARSSEPPPRPEGLWTFVLLLLLPHRESWRTTPHQRFSSCEEQLRLVPRHRQVLHLLGRIFRHRLGGFLRAGGGAWVWSVGRAVGILAVAKYDAANSDAGGSHLNLQQGSGWTDGWRRRRSFSESRESSNTVLRARMFVNNVTGNTSTHGVFEVVGHAHAELHLLQRELQRVAQLLPPAQQHLQQHQRHKATC